MFSINSSATRAFLDALQCPKTVCASLGSDGTTSVCGTAAKLQFIRCDDPAGPMLSIENVSLSGTIDGPLFAAMGNVWVGLFLANRSLSGSIPSELVHSTNLRYLRLENNNLGGTMPTQQSAAAMLDFRVNRNRLSGTIPSTYMSSSGFPEIVRLFFADNQFSGSLPVVNAFPSRLDSLRQQQQFDRHSAGCFGDVVESSKVLLSGIESTLWHAACWHLLGWSVCSLPPSTTIS